MKYKHKVFRELSTRQKIFYSNAFTRFKNNDITVDEFRGLISLLEQEIEEVSNET